MLCFILLILCNRNQDVHLLHENIFFLKLATFLGYVAEKENLCQENGATCL